MAAKRKKTNVMRILEAAGIFYVPLYYDLGDTPFSGEAVSEALGMDKERCFKSLCVQLKTKGFSVFVIPVASELDLKKAAAAADDKSAEMAAVKNLKQIVGYERGTVSPVGMKKPYPVFIDKTATLFDSIEVSAGAHGAAVLVAPDVLAALVGARFADLCD